MKCTLRNSGTEIHSNKEGSSNDGCAHLASWVILLIFNQQRIKWSVSTFRNSRSEIHSNKEGSSNDGCAHLASWVPPPAGRLTRALQGELLVLLSDSSQFILFSILTFSSFYLTTALLFEFHSLFNLYLNHFHTLFNLYLNHQLLLNPSF